MNHFLKIKSLIYSSVLRPLTVQATLSHFFTMAEGTKKGDLSEPKPKEGKVTEKKFEFSSRMFSQQKMTRGATAVQEKERYLKMDLEEKRQCYKCKDKYFLLDDVPSWSSYFKEHKSKLLKHWHGKRPEPGYSVNEELNQKVSIWRGDITKLEIDAIVNAANGSLLGGGGVDGAIHAAAGSMLKVECATLNGCDTGDAKISGGYKLPAKYVIHTVGPIGACDEMLISCYEKSLSLVQEGGLKSVAFPCISTGIYGFPNERAAPLVLQTAREFLEKHGENVDRIIFCLFMPVDVKLYEMHMQQFFPTSTDEKLEGKESTKDVKKDSSVKDGQRNEESSPKAKKSNNMESPSGKISKKEEETIIEKDTVEDSEKGKENDLAKDQHSVKKEEILEVKTESQNNETADKNGLENKNVEKSDVKLEASGEVMDDTTSQNIVKPDKDTTEVHQIPQTNDNDLAEVHKTRQTTNKIAAEVQKSDETKAEDVAEAIKSPQTMDTTDNTTVEGAEKGKITPKL